MMRAFENSLSGLISISLAEWNSSVQPARPLLKRPTNIPEAGILYTFCFIQVISATRLPIKASSGVNPPKTFLEKSSIIKFCPVLPCL